MIIGLPRHPNYLSQDPESNSRTFLEQFALVLPHPTPADDQQLLWRNDLNLESAHDNARFWVLTLKYVKGFTNLYFFVILSVSED